MSELAEFLKARLDDDVVQWSKVQAYEVEMVGEGRRYPAEEIVQEPYLAYVDHFDQARVLREVEAKRRIMARHKPVGPGRLRRVRDELNCEGCGWEGELGDPVTENIDDCPELRDLASIYSDHTDYRAEWAV